MDAYMRWDGGLKWVLEINIPGTVLRLPLTMHMTLDALLTLPLSSFPFLDVRIKWNNLHRGTLEMFVVFSLMIKKRATCREELWPTRAVVTKLFCKDFWLCWLQGLCCNYLALPSSVKAAIDNMWQRGISFTYENWNLNFIQFSHVIIYCSPFAPPPTI